jgi:HEAT repeat protein
MAETAADALGRIGHEAVDELIKYLDDPNPIVRLRTTRVLARIGPDASLAVPALRRLLKDPDPTVRLAAARALGQIGPNAAEAVPDLIEVLDEPETTEAISGRTNG